MYHVINPFNTSKRIVFFAVSFLFYFGCKDTNFFLFGEDLGWFS